MLLTIESVNKGRASASLGASFLDQELGCTIQRIELGITSTNIFWVNLFREWRPQVPHIAVRVDLQYIELPGPGIANNVDAKHRAFRKCCVSALTERDDLGIIAERTHVAAHRAIICRN